MTASRLAKAAQWYAGRGWSVFPLAVRGKIPLISKDDGGRGCLDATDDPERIAAWWSNQPLANIGLACGKASGFWVLDIDVDKGGEKSLAELEHHHGALPATCTVMTGSGGRHFYWSLPAGVEVKNRAGVWPGIDTRSDHGYVVAPPSIHPHGNPYEWREPPNRTPVADAPAWLIKAVTAVREAPTPAAGPRIAIPRDRAVSRARQYLARMPESISGQGGHQRLWAAAITLVVGFDLPADVSLSILRTDFNPRCKPAWSEKELHHKVDDATKARLSRGYMLDRDASAGEAQASVSPESFFLGRVFVEHGALGQEIRPGAWAVMCPTRSIHTSGFDLDATTMLFAPNGPGRPGYFKCAHPECDGIYRDCADVVNALMREERCPA